MDGISNEYVRNAINELVRSLGVKESIPVHDVLGPLHNRKPKECIETMANYLGLPITVNVIIGDSFVSRDLVSTGGTDGVAGITAQVSIPPHLPPYGTPGLKGFPVSVTISDNCQIYPQAFAAIMAHELSHVLLHSVWHREKNNEVYTDFTAMILGFSSVMEYGRKVVETQDHGTFSQTSTTTYGYLSDEQFYFALNLVKKILNEESVRWSDLRARAFQKLTAYRKQLHSYRKMLYELSKLVEYLDSNPSRKIRKEDVPKVIKIHGSGYIEGFASVLRNMETRLRDVESRYAHQFQHPQHHYTTRRLDSLRIFHDDLNTLLSCLASDFSLLNNDVVVLRRCVGLRGRWKVRRYSRV